MESFFSYPKCQKCGGYTDPKWDRTIDGCSCEREEVSPMVVERKNKPVLILDELDSYPESATLKQLFSGRHNILFYPDFEPQKVIPLPGYLLCEVCEGTVYPQGIHPKDSLEECKRCSGKGMVPGPQITQREARTNSHQSFPEDSDKVNLRLLDKTYPPKRVVLEFIKDQWQDLTKEDRDDDLIPVIAPGENFFSLSIFYSRFSYWLKEVHGAAINIPCFTKTEVHDALKSLTYADGFPEGWSYIKAEKLFYRLPIPSSVHSVVSATEEPWWNKYRGKRIAFVQELEREDSDDLSHGVLYRDTDSIFVERLPEDTTPKYKALKEAVTGKSGDIPSLIYPKGKPS